MENQPPSKPLTGLRKRQQIDVTNKHIFIWLAVTSVIVSFCLVGLQFLVKEFIFNQKVINTKSQTNQRLIDNASAAKELTKNINTLLADANLNAVSSSSSSADDRSSALRVIFDALPVRGDPTSFANSLQTVVLPLSGVGIRDLGTSVDVATGGDTLETEGTKDAQTLPFKAGYSGSYAEVQKSLVDLARVIRPIHPTELIIRSEDSNKLQVSISGVTYYLPAQKVDVKTEVIRP